MTRLDIDLIARIRERAADPERRTDAPPTTRGRSVTVGPMTAQPVDLGALLRGDPNPAAAPAGPSELPSAASPEQLAAAEAQLGFALPAQLRQVYAEIANGGFGPGAGLMTLDELVRVYMFLRANPPGRRKQPWPAELLPFTQTEPGHDCIHTGNGSIVVWDEESLADGPSDHVWRRSFKSEAPDLSTWFERWLATKSPEEQMKDHMQAGMNAALRTSLEYWRSKTPEERAAFGLPEEGWEQVLFGHLGIDLSKL